VKKVLARGSLLAFVAFALSACAFNPYDKPHPYYTRGAEILTQEEVKRQDAVVAQCHLVAKETTPSAGELALNRGNKYLGVGVVGGTIGQALSLAVQSAPLTAANVLAGPAWAAPIYGLAGAVNGEIESESAHYYRVDYCATLDKFGVHSIAPSEAAKAPAENQLTPEQRARQGAPQGGDVPPPPAAFAPR